MSTVEAPTRYRPEDLLALPDADRYELVDGRLVERDMGAKSSYVAGEIDSALRGYCRQKRLGWVFPEGAAYQCFPTSPDMVRKPDVSFVRLGKLADERLPE